MTRSKTLVSRFPVGLLGMVLSLATVSPAGAQEVCGLATVQFDALLADGLESLAAPAAASSAVVAAPPSSGKARVLSRADLGRPLGHAERILTGVAPTIAILSPAEGRACPGGPSRRAARSPARSIPG